MGLTTNNDAPLRRSTRIGQAPIVRKPPVGETLLGAPVREAIASNHSETLLGAPVREAMATNHSETLLAGV